MLESDDDIREKVSGYFQVQFRKYVGMGKWVILIPNK